MTIKRLALVTILISCLSLFLYFEYSTKSSAPILIRVFDGYLEMPSRFWLDNRLKNKYCSSYSQDFEKSAAFQGWFHVCGGADLTLDVLTNSLGLTGFKITDDYKFKNFEISKFEKNNAVSEKSDVLKVVVVKRKNQYLVFFNVPNDEYWKNKLENL